MELFNKIKMMWNKRYTKVYISGKITGLRESEYRSNFNNAEKGLRLLGYTRIVNPIKLSDKIIKKLKTPVNNIAYEVFLTKDIEELCKCNLVVQMANWKDSNGAIFEKEVADKLKIKVITVKSLIESGSLK